MNITLYNKIINSIKKGLYESGSMFDDDIFNDDENILSDINVDVHLTYSKELNLKILIKLLTPMCPHAEAVYVNRTGNVTVRYDENNVYTFVFNNGGIQIRMTGRWRSGTKRLGTVKGVWTAFEDGYKAAAYFDKYIHKHEEK